MEKLSNIKLCPEFGKRKFKVYPSYTQTCMHVCSLWKAPDGKKRRSNGWWDDEEGYRSGGKIAKVVAE